MEAMLRRRAMIGSDKDPRIKVLMHLDGDFNDARRHQVFLRNSYNYTFVDGVFDKCVSTNGNCNLHVQGVFTERPSKCTVSCWFNRNDNNGYKMFVDLCKTGGSWDGGAGLRISLVPHQYQGSKMWYRPLGEYSKEVLITSTANTTLNVWQHYAMTYDNGTIRWYQDGVKVAETVVPDLDTNFPYRGNQLCFQHCFYADELMYADDLLIVGDTYDVPQEPYK